jgi:putative ABC transport system permease protein
VITRLLSRLLGRLPIGWLQLAHSRPRLMAAIAGVAFANILVLVQLGILGALNGTVAMNYAPFRADVVISSNDSRMLTDGSPIARRFLAKVQADPDVEDAAPLYIASADWTRPDGSIASMTVYGLPADQPWFLGPLVGGRGHELRVGDVALIDRRMRGLAAGHFDGASLDSPVGIEINHHTLDVIGTFSLGGGFSADGAVLVSDQNFLRLFPQRSGGTPSHVLLRLKPGAGPDVVRRLRAMLDGEPLLVRPLQETIADELDYQTKQRPTGIIFGFGVIIGAIVGVVIVYQVLSTDVADHLKEYATFKAMGYPHRFFLGIVFEEAVILALLGFVPGVAISIAIYVGMAAATGLPVEMTLARALMVLAGTVLACGLSGALATRRLRAADPAELF